MKELKLWTVILGLSLVINFIGFFLLADSSRINIASKAYADFVIQNLNK